MFPVPSCTHLFDSSQGNHSNIKENNAMGHSFDANFVSSHTSASVSVLDRNDNTCNAKHIHENTLKEICSDDTCTDTHSFASTHCLGRAKVISHHRDGPIIMIIDSGATSHMNPDHNTFIKYKFLPPGHYIKLADKSKVPVLGIGSTLQQLRNKHIVLTEVLHVPHLHSPLLSIRSF